MTLVDKKWLPCEGNIPPMSEQEADQKLKEVPGWTLRD